MTMIPLVLLFVLIFTLLLSVCGIYILFGMIVEIEYERHHAEWEQNGRPFGFFKRPDTGESLVSNSKYVDKFGQSFGLVFLWTLRTPRWVHDDPEATRLLRWFRVCVLYWNVGMLAVIGSFLWVAAEAKNAQFPN
jgi:hypothetical protein